MKSLSYKVSILAASVLMAANASAMVIECNDCSPEQRLSSINNQVSGPVFVVDFVNKTVDKYQVTEDGKTQVLDPTKADVSQLNQQFAHRKTHLRDPK